MYIRYNQDLDFWEYDSSDGTGAGPWLILPVNGEHIQGGSGGDVQEVFVGPTDPGTEIPYEIWYDTTNLILKIRVDGVWQPLDYLKYVGAYTTRTYNDGDIVVAEDGIAYMCVKNGTTTAPEQWPGLAISTAVGPPGPKGDKGDPGTPGGDAIADARYWVSQQHPLLLAEVDFGAKADGYVKNAVTGGISNPITVPIIPITDGGTGANTAGNARTNLGLGTMAVQNANDVSITGGQASFRFLDVRHNAEPGMALVNTGSNTFWYYKSGPSGNLDIFNYNADGSNGIASTWITRAGQLNSISFAGNGAALTNLHAPNIATGLVPTARLGNGTANAGTFLRGDQTWQSMSGVPSGLIVMSMAACPPGWTRVNWDGYFLRVGGSPGSTGGAATHVHTLGNLQVANHNHGGGGTISGTTGQAGGHSHGVSASGSTSGNLQGNVVATGPTDTADAGGDIPVTRSPHTHSVNIPANLSVSVSGNTDSAGDHAHSFGGSVGIPSEAPGLVGAMANASNIPPYAEVILCQKD